MVWSNCTISRRVLTMPKSLFKKVLDGVSLSVEEVNYLRHRFYYFWEGVIIKKDGYNNSI